MQRPMQSRKDQDIVRAGDVETKSSHSVNISSRLTVILNVSAGGSSHEEVCQQVVDLFRAGGVDAQIALAESGAEIVQLARQALRQTGDTIVVGGGDGTLNTVAAALVGTDKALGVLPLGTLNHFAKDVQIPLDLEAAVRTIIEGRVIRVDVGEVNGHIFLNNSSLGLYPNLVKEREAHQRRGWSKWLAFGFAALKVLYRYPRVQVRVHLDGRELVRTSPLLFVGNNEYLLEGLNLGARRCLDQGLLCVYVLHQTGRWGILRLLWHLLRRKRQGANDFDALYTPEILVEARRKRKRMRVALDGEVIVLYTPLEYRIRSAALRVIVPQEANGLKS
jgi:YegS/Rv2252/BmrU family lipid kinase